MRILFIAIVLLSLTAPASAQNERAIVGTAPFLRTTAVDGNSASWVQAMASVPLAKRFKIVEIAGIQAIYDEINEQRKEEYLDGIVTAVEPMTER